jgi:ribosomal protein L40E
MSEESCWVCPNCQAQVPSDCDVCQNCGYSEAVEDLEVEA